jgi:hypothetical protein
MADEIIEELWAIKDEIAKEADYDVDKLIDLLQEKQERREESTPSNSGRENTACVDDTTFPAK